MRVSAIPSELPLVVPAPDAAQQQSPRLRPLIRSVVAVGTHPACDAVGVAALVALQVSRPIGVGLAAVAVLAVLLVNRTPVKLVHGLGPTGRGVLPRIAFVIAAGVRAPAGPLWFAASAVCLALLLEPLVQRVSRAAVPVAAGLPDLRVRNAPLIPTGRLFVVDLIAAIAVGLAGLTGTGVVVALVVGTAAAALALVLCIDAGLRIRTRRAVDPALFAAIERHGPRFAVHWDATPGTEYQLAMWLPHLERIGTAFVVVVRNPATFDSVAALTAAPVVLRRDPGDLDAVVVPGLGTAFYVNNAARNAHLVRFAGLEHVQLGHGDSDKAPSFSPVHRLYTRTFVSGVAAVERFAQHGVLVPEESFTVVGRPQVVGMLVGDAVSAERTALYAPTWAGANADSDYSSLPAGEAIVGALLDQGYRVLFRPHPYTRRSPLLAAAADAVDALLAADAGRHHVGSRAAAELALHDCFDAAHLLVSDVSSVPADFLQSEKPYLLVAVATDAETLEQESSLAPGGYVTDGEPADLARQLAAAGGADPRLAARRALKTRVLGDLGPDAFVERARAVVLEPSPHRPAA